MKVTSVKDLFCVGCQFYDGCNGRMEWLVSGATLEIICGAQPIGRTITR